MRGFHIRLSFYFLPLLFVLCLWSVRVEAGKPVCDDHLISLAKRFVKESIFSLNDQRVRVSFEAARGQQVITTVEARDSEGSKRRAKIDTLAQSNRMIYPFLNEWESFHLVPILKSRKELLDQQGKAVSIWEFLSTQYRDVFTKVFPTRDEARFEGIRLAGQEGLPIDTLDFDLLDMHLTRVQRARFFLGLFTQYLALEAASSKSPHHSMAVDILTDLYQAAERSSPRMNVWRNQELTTPSKPKPAKPGRMHPGHWSYEDYYDYSDARLKSILDMIQEAYADERAQSRDGLDVDDEFLEDRPQGSDVTGEQEHLRQSDFDQFLKESLAHLDTIDFYRPLPIGQSGRGLNLVQQLQLSPFAAQAERAPALTFLPQNSPPKSPQ